MKKLKKTIGVLTLAIMLMCSAVGCETTKLATPGEEKKISSQAEEKKTVTNKTEKKETDKQPAEKEAKEEEEEYLDAETVEDKEINYSKYEERKSSATQSGGSTGNQGNEGTDKQDQYHTDPVPEGMPTPEINYSKYEERKSSATQSGGSTGNQGNEGTDKQDQYHTDPVPEGMPTPVEPENAEVNTSSEDVCYLSISCDTILDNMDDLIPGKESMVSSDGVIFPETEVSFYEGESVFDVLQRVTKNNRIHMESSFTPKYNSAYVEGINNLYEFDCGELSGWMYEVNGWYPNYGCSRYQVKAGDVIHWNYTCDLGRDLGQTWVE